MDRKAFLAFVQDNEKFNSLTAFSESLFFRLLCGCDDMGYMDANPDTIKGLLYPNKSVRPSQIKDALRALYSAELLSLWKKDGKTFVRPTVWVWRQPSGEAGSAEQAPTKAKASADMSQAMLARFDRFWAAYPRKVGKGAARRKFAQIKPDDALTDRMIQAVEKAKQSQQWTKDGGAYIPHPTTWLNQERWEDELQPPQERDVTVLYNTRLEDWD